MIREEDGPSRGDRRKLLLRHQSGDKVPSSLSLSGVWAKLGGRSPGSVPEKNITNYEVTPGIVNLMLHNDHDCKTGISPARQ